MLFTWCEIKCDSVDSGDTIHGEGIGLNHEGIDDIVYFPYISP